MVNKNVTSSVCLPPFYQGFLAIDMESFGFIIRCECFYLVLRDLSEGRELQRTSNWTSLKDKQLGTT